jgi:hypothetical protein
MGNDLLTVFNHWFRKPPHLSHAQYMQTQFERMALDYSDILLEFLRFDPHFVHEFPTYEPFTLLMQIRPEETYPLLKKHMEMCEDCIPFSLLDVFFLDPQPQQAVVREYRNFNEYNNRYYILPIGKSKEEYFALVPASTIISYLNLGYLENGTFQVYPFLKIIQQMICDFPYRIIMRFGTPIKDALADSNLKIYSHYLLNWLKKNFASIVLPILEKRHIAVPLLRNRNKG